jgi:hypothetical protein
LGFQTLKLVQRHMILVEIFTRTEDKELIS